jgi:CheY-like chemotaxis protein
VVYRYEILAAVLEFRQVCSPGGMTLSRLATEMLQAPGYTVEAVTTGEKAVELYRLRKEEGSPFEAVILDIYQPDGIGGEETMKRNEGIRGVIIFAEVESNQRKRIIPVSKNEKNVIGYMEK